MITTTTKAQKAVPVDIDEKTRHRVYDPCQIAVWDALDSTTFYFVRVDPWLMGDMKWVFDPLYTDISL